MKITYESANYVKIGSMDIGSTFLITDEFDDSTIIHEFYMVCDPSTGILTDKRYAVCVNLYDGNLRLFNKDALVEPVEMECVAKRLS